MTPADDRLLALAKAYDDRERDLNGKVTTAIIASRHHPSRAAFERVARAEQALVDFLPVGSLERDIALKGVVWATEDAERYV